MASGFTLSLYPWIYIAHRSAVDDAWEDNYIEKNHSTLAEEQQLGAEEMDMIARERNNDPMLPLVNVSTQYGLSCFEGAKAFPHADGKLYLFRIDQNAIRMAKSMEGLCMPQFAPQKFIDCVCELVRRNYRLGYYTTYQPEWRDNDYMDARSVYIRPFSYAEPGIGLQLSKRPSVVIVTTPVGSYLDYDVPLSAITTDMVRATPGGTGWIKCSSNYVIPIIAKGRAQQQGHTEPIFLDCKTQTYIEECSSCNIFFYLKDNTLVTPALNDTILPGITRSSIIELARDVGVKVEERPISIDEALHNTKECFITGTAVGVSQITQITHGDVTATFNNNKIGALTIEMRDTLKGIQYGTIEDRKGWLVQIE